MGKPPTATDDIADDEAWTPPGMSPMRKVGLTVLMVILGVIPGLLLLASDPLPDSPDELTPESVPVAEGIDAHETPGGDAVFSPEVPPPETPAPPTPEPAAEEAVVIEPDRDDELEDRDDRPRNGHASEERSSPRERIKEDADEDADDLDDEPEPEPVEEPVEEPDDDRPFISLRLGRWGWG